MTTILTFDERTWSLDEALAYTRRLTKSHYENFTVGSLLLPKPIRQHVSNLYAYCRTVDDFGDEAEGDRRHLLDQWCDDLERCYTNDAPTHPVMVALQHTIQRFNIPREPFLKLIEANQIDQEVSRYDTFEDLLHYCDHSANPCGRLFLYVFDYRDEKRQRLADHTCTALQLTNFWQDVNRDWQKGRVYIPLEDLKAHNVSEDQIARREFDDNFRRLMAFQVERTRRIFRQGAQLLNHLEGHAKTDVALFTRGGMAVLDAIEKQDYDVLKRRPSLSRLKKARLLLSTWTRMKLGATPRF